MSDIFCKNTISKKFEQVSNVNVVTFYNLLESLDMIDKFKQIFSKNGGITYDNKNLFIREIRNTRKIPREQQKMILFEQMFSCKLCDVKTFDIEVDHIQPLFMGGNNRRENLQGLCRLCHGLKSAEERVSLDECIDYMYNDFLPEIKELRKEVLSQTPDNNVVVPVDSTETSTTEKTTTVVNKVETYEGINITTNEKTTISKKLITLTKTPRSERYKCEICLKIYQDHSGLRRHKLSNKKCVPFEMQSQFKDIIQIEKENTKILLEKKNIEFNKLLEEKDYEITRLKNVIENAFQKKN